MSQGSEGFSELSQYTLDRNSVRLLPEPFCRRHHVVVPGKVDPVAPNATVTVGMLNPDTPHIITRIGDLLERSIRPVQLNRYEIESALQAGFGSGPRVTADVVIRHRPTSRTHPNAVEFVDSILATAGSTCRSVRSMRHGVGPPSSYLLPSAVPTGGLHAVAPYGNEYACAHDDDGLPL